MSVVIRSATSDDLPRLLELYELLESGDAPSLSPEGARRAWDALTAVPDHVIYVAESQDGVVGTFALIFIVGWRTGHDASAWWRMSWWRRTRADEARKDDDALRHAALRGAVLLQACPVQPFASGGSAPLL